jgi:bifunctional pyridoxal-dependent enzyme with beta-cystathionase and maltose regulon repressor activities
MPREIHKRWTGEEIAKLKNLAHKHRLSVIAAELGRTAAPLQ